MTAGPAAPPALAPAAGTLAFHLGVPLAAGAACVAGFAPFHAWPVPILALAALFLVWQRSGSPRQAALSGFTFGLGFFLTGVSWVYVSMHVFGSMPAALAATATFFFCAYLALFPMAAGWAVARFGATPARRMLLAPAAFVAFEWLRGWLFTGFPWLNIGTSQVPGSPLAGYAPYVGAYGVSLAVAGGAALLSTLPLRRASPRRLAAIAGSLAALFAVGAVGFLPTWTRPAGEPITLGLLQGNVPQRLKWQEDVRTKTLLDYRRMIFEAPARVVVIPETALPGPFLDMLPREYVASLREHARAAGKDIVVGTAERVFRGAEFDYYNSAVVLGAGEVQSYRKRHLVPFGEFIPTGFGWVLNVLKIPLTDFARGGDTQKPLVAGGVTFGVAICYEDMFGEEVIAFMPSAQVLLNVSNMAWFGDTWAADQHLQASQMRALETGRWMVRSTNTGATAAIDERGRVVSRLPAFTTGTLVERVTPREGMTPYARFGNVPVLVLLALLAFFGRPRRL